MKFDIIATDPFERKIKRLAKKYRALAADLSQVIEELEENPTMGMALGKGCYKIRVAISSKGKGKSGSARLITYVRIIKNTVYLLDIYDKADQQNISDKELQLFINLLADEE